MVAGFHNKRSYAAIFVISIILMAIAARVISKFEILPIELGLLRATLYVVLYIVWGVSLRMRIVHPPVRRCLTAVAALMVFWFVVRSMKYFFVTDASVSRLLWYSYYIPILFIPLLGLFVSLSLGMPESYRLPKWAAAAAVITAACSALVLTNDLHQLVFSFPEGGIRSDKNYEYTVGFYIIFGWGIACALAAFVLMVYKCRISGRKKYLPVILLVLDVIYAGVYSTGLEWVRIVAGDVAAAQCLMFAAIFESCISCGLIRTNSGYDSLFEACTLKMQIADSGGNIRYASAGARELSEDIMLGAQAAAYPIDNNTLIKSADIEGGRVYWQEDITELSAVIDELEENRRQLAERNFLARENYETQRRIISLHEKNRLYDILHKQTAPQIALLDEIFAEYDGESDEEKRRSLLAMTAVVGAYIKRYGNLLFVGEKNDYVEFGELARCIAESFANLELMGVICGCDAGLCETVRTADALRAYSTLERIIEAALSDLSSIWIKAKSRADCITVLIEAECGCDLASISEYADGFSVEDGIFRFDIRLEKAGEAA